MGLHCVVYLESQTYSEAEDQCHTFNMKLWPGPDQDLSQVGKIEIEIFSPL